MIGASGARRDGTGRRVRLGGLLRGRLALGMAPVQIAPDSPRRPHRFFGPDEAVTDFRARIAHDQRVYEPLDDDERAYLRVTGAGRGVTASDVDGYLAARLAFVPMALRLTGRLTHHRARAIAITADQSLARLRGAERVSGSGHGSAGPSEKDDEDTPRARSKKGNPRRLSTKACRTARALGRLRR
jgi:hypothetical protein